ncbi:MAG TPA: hypothetical protein VLI94_05350 [Solirubrobacterales bacterium]|nr:hypothetical protein [Solirubrobacterales bacterium]
MSLLLLLGGYEPETAPRIAVNREYPSVQHRVIVRDPKTGSAIARWAEDEARTHNVMNGLQLSGGIPGGRKELRCSLPRNPRQDWPDIEGFLEIEAQIGARNRIWHGRIGKAPRSDGERMVIDGEAVGYAAALEDRKALRLGFIDSDLGKWGEPSASRRLALRDQGRYTTVQATSGFRDSGSARPALIVDYSGTVRQEGNVPGNELWYHGGGVDLGALRFDWLSDAFNEFESFFRLVDNDLPVTGNFDPSPDVNYSGKAEALNQEVKATTPGRRYAALKSFHTGGYRGTMTNIHRAANLKVLSYLATQNLTLQGTWPDVGYTAAQMLRVLVPEFSGLQVSDDSIEDDGFIIQQAWWPDGTTLGPVVDELVRYGLYDWFVKDGKVFELRKPGTYGRRWQAYQGPSNFREAGTDTERLWDRICVRYQDPDGSTRMVGWPGSGAEVESAALQVTDPDHPAVRAGVVREDLLDLQTQSVPSEAIGVGERWLAEANELSRSGEAELSGYVQDDRGVYRPAAEIAEGDLIRFPDARDKSYRRIVSYDYSADERKVTVSLDAPSETIQALLERYRAALLPIGVR